VVVLDEAQAIKNFDSQTARAAFDLKGTSALRSAELLWKTARRALERDELRQPGLLGSVGDFRERYVAPISNGHSEAADRLRAKIRPFVLRRTKSEVLPELPPRTDCVINVELDESEREVYDAVRAATRQSVVDKLAQHGGAGVLAALEALLRLRQAACIQPSSPVSAQTPLQRSFVLSRRSRSP